MDDHTVVLSISIAESFLPYADRALTRLGYLRPDWRLEIQDLTLQATVPVETAEQLVQREVQYALYREKTFVETLQMRQELLKLVSKE